MCIRDSINCANVVNPRRTDDARWPKHNAETLRKNCARSSKRKSHLDGILFGRSMRQKVICFGHGNPRPPLLPELMSKALRMRDTAAEVDLSAPSWRLWLCPVPIQYKQLPQPRAWPYQYAVAVSRDGTSKAALRKHFGFQDVS